jgi:hypothetical protein
VKLARNTRGHEGLAGNFPNKEQALEIIVPIDATCPIHSHFLSILDPRTNPGGIFHANPSLNACP